MFPGPVDHESFGGAHVGRDPVLIDGSDEANGTGGSGESGWSNGPDGSGGSGGSGGSVGSNETDGSNSSVGLGSDGVEADQDAEPHDGPSTALAKHVADSDERNITELVEQPAKVMRIGSMIKQLLEEVRNAPLDDASRARLKEIHARSIAELEDGLAPELVAELDRLSLPFADESTPSDAELRIAQAQLVGWLEGLFHGIQTALFAQQMAARAQLEEMQRQMALGSGEAGDSGGAAIPGTNNPNGPYL